MQTRLTTLETKWDTVIPTLATREDLLALEGRLRDDMRHGFVDLQRWLISAMQRWLLIVLAVVATLSGGAGVMLSKRTSLPASLAAAVPLDPAVPALSSSLADLGLADLGLGSAALAVPPEPTAQAADAAPASGGDQPG